MLPLTRTASPLDFPGCLSMAEWQQAHAVDAYQRWVDTVNLTSAPFPQEVLCLNWGAASFRAPGPDPIYRSYGDSIADLPLLAVAFGLSVLDRVDAPIRWLRHIAECLEPGGLIVCTFAAWDAMGEDCAVGHELRHRIYNRESWHDLLEGARRYDLRPFGNVDFRYRGHTLGDHTLATLVVTKGRCGHGS